MINSCEQHISKFDGKRFANMLSSIILLNVFRFDWFEHARIYFIILILIIYLFFAYRDLKKSKIVLIIDAKGIKDMILNHQYLWKDIKYAGYRFDCLIIKLEKETVEIELQNVTNHRKAKKLIEYYSTYYIESRDDIAIAGSLRNTENPERIINYLKSQRKYVTYIPGLVFIIIMAITIYWQSKTSFPYIFSFGLSSSIIVATLIETLIAEKVASNSVLKVLEPKNLETVLIEYGIETPYSMAKSGGIIVGIFIVISYIASYLIANYI